MNILLHTDILLVFFHIIARKYLPFSDTDEKEEFFTPEAKTKAIGHSLQLNGTVVTRVQ